MGAAGRCRCRAFRAWALARTPRAGSASPAIAVFRNARRVTPARERNTGRYTNSMFRRVREAVGHDPSRLPLILALTTFLLYWITLAPSFSWGDSADLPLRVYGEPHSEAQATARDYVLYRLVGRAFLQLPFGDVAYRLNLLSATASVAGVMAVFLMVRRRTGRDGPARRCGPGAGVLAHVVVDVGGQRDLHLRRVPDVVVVMVLAGMEQPWRAGLADRGCADVGTRRLRAWRRRAVAGAGSLLCLSIPRSCSWPRLARRRPGHAGRLGVHHRDGGRRTRAGRHRRTQRGHRCQQPDGGRAVLAHG